MLNEVVAKLLAVSGVCAQRSNSSISCSRKPTGCFSPSHASASHLQPLMELSCVQRGEDWKLDMLES